MGLLRDDDAAFQAEGSRKPNCVTQTHGIRSRDDLRRANASELRADQAKGRFGH